MTPNLNAIPLAALSTNPPTTADDVHNLPDPHHPASRDGLPAMLGEPIFSDVLQSLKVPLTGGQAILTPDSAQTGEQSADLTDISFLAPLDAPPVVIPGTVTVQSQQTPAEPAGALPPAGGNALPPTVREALTQLRVISNEAAPTPTPVPAGSAANANLQPSPPVHHGPLAGSTTPPAIEPAALKDAMPEFVKLQKLKPAQHQPVGPLSATPPGIDKPLTVAETQVPSADLVRLAAVTPDKATLQPATAAALPLARPAGTTGWDQALGQRILWMVDKGLGQAELRLDPPHLGSVNVRIAVREDQAQVLFQAVHPAARDALEAAIPRLREMFADQGLQLGSADVGGQDGRPTNGSDRERADGDTAQGAADSPMAAPDSDAQPDHGIESPLQVRGNDQLLVDEVV